MQVTPSASSYRPGASDRERIIRLEEENRQLRAHIFQLEGRGYVPAIRRVFDLTGNQARLLGLLAKRLEITRQECIMVLYDDDRHARLEDPYKAVADVMKYVRKKTRVFGLEIETVYGQGWRVSTETQAALRKLIEAAP